MKTTYKYTNTPKKQEGAALIISLIILIALTIIVLTSARSSIMEVAMGVNNQAQAEALNQAEDSVRVGENYILTQYNAGEILRDAVSDSTTDGLHGKDDITHSMDWSGIKTFKKLDASNNVAAEYTIEYIGIMQDNLGGTNISIGDRLVYRVSGLGLSSSGAGRIVQTYYATLTE